VVVEAPFPVRLLIPGMGRTFRRGLELVEGLIDLAIQDPKGIIHDILLIL